MLQEKVTIIIIIIIIIVIIIIIIIMTFNCFFKDNFLDYL